MKKNILFVFIYSLLISCSQEKATTYYLIRHAEKDRTDLTNRNPNLNDKGIERAKKWAEYFKGIDLDAVYSTDYNRTQQTATPTSISKNLDIISYDPKNQYTPNFQNNTKGKSVLIVGHSNTIPKFANEILNTNSFKDINDNENSKLFIISIKPSFIKKNASVRIVHVN